MAKDIYLCTTPLQILIVRSLIMMNNNKVKPDIYILAKENSQKHKYYHELIKPFADSTYYFEDIGNSVYPIFGLYKKFKNKEYGNVYLANIDASHFHYILSFIKFKNIFTFDDGTLNICTDCYLHKTKSGFLFFIKGFMKRLIGNKYNMNKIKKLTKEHYSLYPGFKNMVSNVKFIKLNLLANNIEVNKKPAKIIFLGTVYRELVVPENGVIEIILEKVAKYLSGFSDPVQYLPHPREEIKKIYNIETLDTELVAEDIVISLLNEFEKVILVGFANSTQFNFINDTRVSSIILDSKFFNQKTLSLISLISNKGVEVVCLDEL